MLPMPNIKRRIILLTLHSIEALDLIAIFSSLYNSIEYCYYTLMNYSKVRHVIRIFLR